MAAIWGAAIAGAVQLGSSLLGSSKAKKAAKQQKAFTKNQLQIAGTSYSPVNVNTPGGGGVTFGNQNQPTSWGGYQSPTNGGGTYQIPGGENSGSQFIGANGQPVTGGSLGINNGNVTPIRGNEGVVNFGNGFRQVGKYGLQSDLGSINTSVGDLEGLRQFGVGQGDQIQQLGAMNDGSLTPGQTLGLGTAFSGLEGMNGANQDLGPMQFLAGSALGQSYGDMQQTRQNPFAAGLQDQVLGDAAGQLGYAGGDFSGVYNDTLGLLRSSAAHGEQLQGANFLQRMFDTGGRGTTGGANQTQAFMRGLGEADTTRQLQALGEARNQQNQALNVGTGLYNVGQGISSQQDSLMNNALSRFGNLGNWAQGLSQQRFNQGQGMVDAGNSLFNLGSAAYDEPSRRVQQNQSLQQNLLANQTALQAFGMAPADLALRAMAGQASTRLGQASVNGSNLSAPAAMNASLWGSIGANAGAFGQLGQSLAQGYQNRYGSNVSGRGGLNESLARFPNG